LQRAMVPIYLALGRADDALTACRKTLELDPGDHETWFVLARQLREQGQVKESAQALEKGVACPSAQESLDVLVQMYFDLGNLQQDAKNYTQAEKAFREVARIMDEHREALLESGPYDPDQLVQEAAKTYERIGEVCMQAGAHERAVKAFREAQ